MGDLRSALSVLAAGLVLLGFATPLRVLWSGLSWWVPFALWALAIALLALSARGGDGRPGP